MEFGAIAITQLLITSTTISFLSTQFVIAELFCSINNQQYNHQFTYERTYIVHPIPVGTEECLIRLRSGINIFTKIIEL